MTPSELLHKVGRVFDYKNTIVYRKKKGRLFENVFGDIR